MDLPRFHVSTAAQSFIQTRLEDVKDLSFVGAWRVGLYDAMLFVLTPFEFGIILRGVLCSVFIKIWFESRLLILPKSVIAVPMSEPAPPPKTCTSLMLFMSVSPKLISTQPWEEF